MEPLIRGFPRWKASASVSASSHRHQVFCQSGWPSTAPFPRRLALDAPGAAGESCPCSFPPSHRLLLTVGQRRVETQTPSTHVQRLPSRPTPVPPRLLPGNTVLGVASSPQMGKVGSEGGNLTHLYSSRLSLPGRCLASVRTGQDCYENLHAADAHVPPSQQGSPEAAPEACLSGTAGPAMESAEARARSLPLKENQPYPLPRYFKNVAFPHKNLRRRQKSKAE